jgi:hypothetical protein
VNVYPFIEAEKAQRHSVTRACRLSEVSRSAYYAHRAGPSARAQQDAELTARIVEVHDGSGGSYGAPRVPGLLRSRVIPGHGVDEVVGSAVGASGDSGDVGFAVGAVVSDGGVS